MYRVLTFAVFLYCCASSVANAECTTQLKPTDGYKELSAILKCMQYEINTLKKEQQETATPAALKRPTSSRAVEVQNGTLRVELTGCSVKNRNGIYCNFQFTNLTKQDKKVCLGRGARLVAENGNSFSASTNLWSQIGSRAGGYDICDEITPLSKVSAQVGFWGSQDSAQGKIQFLRMDCGASCSYEAYDLPIN